MTNLTSFSLIILFKHILLHEHDYHSFVHAYIYKNGLVQFLTSRQIFLAIVLLMDWGSSHETPKWRQLFTNIP